METSATLVCTHTSMWRLIAACAPRSNCACCAYNSRLPGIQLPQQHDIMQYDTRVHWCRCSWLRLKVYAATLLRSIFLSTTCKVRKFYKKFKFLQPKSDDNAPHYFQRKQGTRYLQSCTGKGQQLCLTAWPGLPSALLRSK